MYFCSAIICLSNSIKSQPNTTTTGYTHQQCFCYLTHKESKMIGSIKTKWTKTFFTKNRAAVALGISNKKQKTCERSGVDKASLYVKEISSNSLECKTLLTLSKMSCTFTLLFKMDWHFICNSLCVYSALWKRHSDSVFTCVSFQDKAIGRTATVIDLLICSTVIIIVSVISGWNHW